MKYLTLTQAAKQSGLSQQKIRYISNKGYLHKVHRRPTKLVGDNPIQFNRIFTPKQVEVLTQINQLKSEGFLLSTAVAKAWDIVDAV